MGNTNTNIISNENTVIDLYLKNGIIEGYFLKNNNQYLNKNSEKITFEFDDIIPITINTQTLNGQIYFFENNGNILFSNCETGLDTKGLNNLKPLGHIFFNDF